MPSPAGTAVVPFVFGDQQLVNPSDIVNAFDTQDRVLKGQQQLLSRMPFGPDQTQVALSSALVKMQDQLNTQMGIFEQAIQAMYWYVNQIAAGNTIITALRSELKTTRELIDGLRAGQQSAVISATQAGAVAQVNSFQVEDLSGQVAKLREDNERLFKQVTDLTGQIAGVAAGISTGLKNTLGALPTEVQAELKEVADKTNYASFVTMLDGALNRAWTAKETQLGEAKTRLSALEAQHDAEVENKRLREDERTQQAGKIAELEEKLRNALTESAKKEGQLDSLRSANEKLHKDEGLLRTEIAGQKATIEDLMAKSTPTKAEEEQRQSRALVAEADAKKAAEEKNKLILQANNARNEADASAHELGEQKALVKASQAKLDANTALIIKLQADLEAEQRAHGESKRKALEGIGVGIGGFEDFAKRYQIRSNKGGRALTFEESAALIVPLAPAPAPAPVLVTPPAPAPAVPAPAPGPAVLVPNTPVSAPGPAVFVPSTPAPASGPVNEPFKAAVDMDVEPNSDARNALVLIPPEMTRLNVIAPLALTSAFGPDSYGPLIDRKTADPDKREIFAQDFLDFDAMVEDRAWSLAIVDLLSDKANGYRNSIYDFITPLGARLEYIYRQAQNGSTELLFVVDLLRVYNTLNRRTPRVNQLNAFAVRYVPHTRNHMTRIANAVAQNMQQIHDAGSEKDSEPFWWSDSDFVARFSAIWKADGDNSRKLFNIYDDRLNAAIHGNSYFYRAMSQVFEPERQGMLPLLREMCGVLWNANNVRANFTTLLALPGGATMLAVYFSQSGTEGFRQLLGDLTFSTNWNQFLVGVQNTGQKNTLEDAGRMVQLTWLESSLSLTQQ